MLFQTLGHAPWRNEEREHEYELTNIEKAIMEKRVGLLCLMSLAVLGSAAQEPFFTQKVEGTSTQILIDNLSSQARIDPMIYGQMLEDCNDNVVYGGVVSKEGVVNATVAKKLSALQIPVMRWPAGTAIYDYEWQKGVGPIRTAVKEKIWAGYEYYTFGTDEFISWCRKMNTEPYINIPMGNNNTFSHSLKDALDWVKYVNDTADSPMGALRARNGHESPYGVKYWCLGNENYLGNVFHTSESAETYAAMFKDYASAIKRLFPDVRLLGVGHTGSWNKTVVSECGEYLDFMTLHFYLNAKVDGSVLTEPEKTLFAPEKVEANIRLYARDLEEYNKSMGRTRNPIRFSVDEWNCRHSVRKGNGYSFTRKDARRLYDAAAIASMLNVFIHTSPNVGMANYIFPVNGHGLLKTVGEQDAYETPAYYVFDLYRRFMKGCAVGGSVRGPGLKDVNLTGLNLSGDADAALRNVTGDFCFVGCAAAVDGEGRLAVAMVNRSYDTPQRVALHVEGRVDGYEVVEAWSLSHTDVCAENTPENRHNVKASRITVVNNTIELNPCAVAVVVMKKRDGGKLVGRVGSVRGGGA